MLIGVVHTAGAPCGCAQAVESGLKELGHQVLIFDSKTITLQAPDIADSCRLVIDHTDTFHEVGFLRPVVRAILENYGAHIVGSPASACFLADDKAAAKRVLAAAGVPVPPGILVTAPGQQIPSDLGSPIILKPSCEHMSRGLYLAGSAEEAADRIPELLDRFQQPLLAESFVPGRELAVSLLEDKSELWVLPPLEWLPEEGSFGILTENFKLAEPQPQRKNAIRADLAPTLLAELEDMARNSFRALGLRDYARFDIRLSPENIPYFLEANTTPSLEHQEALSLSASWAGMSYPALVEKMLQAAERRYSRIF